MASIGVTSLRGIVHEDFMYPFALDAAITKDDEGKAVTLDTSGANKVKLAADGDFIIGRLEVVEVRTVEGVNVGTVSLFGGMKLPVNPNATASSPDETPSVGDYVVGGTANDGKKGYVQRAQSGGRTNKWLVVEVLDSGANVVVIGV